MIAKIGIELDLDDHEWKRPLGLGADWRRQEEGYATPPISASVKSLVAQKAGGIILENCFGEKSSKQYR